MKIEQIPIESLTSDPSNVRKHNQKNLEAIKGSLKKFGQQKPIVISHENIVIAGNGTLAAAISLGWKSIDAVKTDLKGSDLAAFGIADNRTSELAEWDDAELAKMLDALKAEDFDLSAIGFDDADLKEINVSIGSTDGDGSLSENYSQNIKAPIYTPKGEKPLVSELFDNKKTEELKKKISSKKLPEEIKKFLEIAAERHTVFNFRNIAEYYCHSEKDLQEMMEESALVIIDFKKAIELGFVSLTKKLSTLADEEGPANEE